MAGKPQLPDKAKFVYRFLSSFLKEKKIVIITSIQWLSKFKNKEWTTIVPAPSLFSRLWMSRVHGMSCWPQADVLGLHWGLKLEGGRELGRIAGRFSPMSPNQRNHNICFRDLLELWKQNKAACLLVEYSLSQRPKAWSDDTEGAFLWFSEKQWFQHCGGKALP